MTKKKKRALGKGIDALFPDAALIEEEIDPSNERVQEIKLADIRPNPYQPRQNFNQEALEGLAASIKESGVLQPILVRKSSVKGYEIIAGERRVRASKLAQKTSIPAIIRDLNEETMMQVAILENLQREDLTALEEADAYHMMMEKLSMTQDQVALKLGKSRSYIANHLRLRNLPQEAKDLLQAGNLSNGQARTLLALEDEDKIVRLAHRAAQENLTVRQLEHLVAEAKVHKPSVKPTLAPAKKSVFIRDLEDRLTDQMDARVTITEKGNKGKIEIEYSSIDNLNDILESSFGLDLSQD